MLVSGPKERKSVVVRIRYERFILMTEDPTILSWTLSDESNSFPLPHIERWRGRGMDNCKFYDLIFTYVWIPRSHLLFQSIHLVINPLFKPYVYHVVSFSTYFVSCFPPSLCCRSIGITRLSPLREFCFLDWKDARSMDTISQKKGITCFCYFILCKTFR